MAVTRPTVPPTLRSHTVGTFAKPIRSLNSEYFNKLVFPFYMQKLRDRKVSRIPGHEFESTPSVFFKLTTHRDVLTSSGQN